MRVIHIVAESYHKTDVFIQMMNAHSKRQHMDLRAAVRVSQLPSSGEVLLIPSFSGGWQAEIERAMQLRGLRWSEVDMGGGWVLGELL